MICTIQLFVSQEYKCSYFCFIYVKRQGKTVTGMLFYSIQVLKWALF